MPMIYDWSELNNLMGQTQANLSDLRDQCQQANLRVQTLAEEQASVIKELQKEHPHSTRAKRALKAEVRVQLRQLRAQQWFSVRLRLHLGVAYLRYGIIWCLRRIRRFAYWTGDVFCQLMAAVSRLIAAPFRKLKQLLTSRRKR